MLLSSWFCDGGHCSQGRAPTIACNTRLKSLASKNHGAEAMVPSGNGARGRACSINCIFILLVLESGVHGQEGRISEKGQGSQIGCRAHSCKATGPTCKKWPG